MTRFRDVQQAIIMAAVWVDDEKMKSDCNFQKKKTWNCVCVVKPNDKTSNTNDIVTTKTNTVHMKRDTWQVSVHVVFLLVRVVVIFTHCTPHRVAQVVRVFALISSMHEVSVALRLWALHSMQLPLLFLHLQFPAVPADLLLPRGSVVALCTPPTRRWGLRTNPTPTQVMSPRTASSRRLMSSPSQSPWPTHSSPNNGFSRMWITMTPRSRRCFITHTENMSITPSEKACLLVSRRRPCPKERSDLLESEQGDLLDQLVRS